MSLFKSLSTKQMCGMACSLLFIVLGWISRDYMWLNMSQSGFEWTERYGTILKCAGRTFLLTRMRHMYAGKYVPVLRIQGERTARILWNMTLLAYNPTIYCVDRAVYLMGSSNSEWHVDFGYGFATAVWKARIYPTMGDILDSGLNVSSCIERFFPSCAFDGKFSVVVTRYGRTLVYIRTNTVPKGGGRFVQMAEHRNGSWTPFRLLHIEGMVPATDLNIYIFEVSLCKDGSFEAHFPAVMNGEGWILKSFSADGLHWSKAMRLFQVQTFGVRTHILPVGTSHIMDINLFFHTRTVQLRLIPGGRRDHSFFTRRWVDQQHLPTRPTFNSSVSSRHFDRPRQ